MIDGAQICPRCNVLRIEGCCMNGFNADVRRHMETMDTQMLRDGNATRARLRYGLIPLSVATLVGTVAAATISYLTSGPVIMVGVNVGLASMLAMNLWTCIAHLNRIDETIATLEKRRAPRLPGGPVELFDAAHCAQPEHTEQQRQ